MNKNIKISVIIPYFKAKNFIIETINSVLNQTYTNFEIILVDDGSNDNLYDKYKDFFKLKNIEYVRKENGGPASARNLGIKKSNGELIAFLDADDIWKKNKLEKQIEFFRDENVGLVYSKRGEFLSGDIINNIQIPKFTLFKGDVLKKLLDNNFITNSSVIIKRDVINKCGCFNENKKFFAIEDYEYWLRISSRFSIGFVDESLVFYRQHSKQISNQNNKNFYRLSKMFFNFFITNELKKYRFKILLKGIRFYFAYIKSIILNKIVKKI